MRLPQPDADALHLSERLLELMRRQAEDGWLAFSRYMAMALYAPGLGYYSAGSHKIGGAGDFITAPELSPLFADCLAKQCQQALSALAGGSVLELGAGTGRLAFDLLTALENQDSAPDEYLILEPSAELRQRQQQCLQALPRDLSQRVRWLDALPSDGQFRGVVIANEVMDAMPVELFVWQAGEVFQRGVRLHEPLRWEDRPAPPALADAVQKLYAATGSQWPDGYTSEVNLALPAWVAALSAALEAGLMILVDYGYPRPEYYRGERSMGTLIAHYRHRVLDDPLLWPGLMDITANVDFTALAEAADAAHLDVLGYTTQSWFLQALGLEEAFHARNTGKPRDQLNLVAQVRQLTLPAEMGERFQVMLLGKQLAIEPWGTRLKDLRHRL